MSSQSIKSKSHFVNVPLFEKNEKLRCLFCGGKNCKNEDYTRHERKDPAIIGLNSDLIDENIYASQRPSNTLIKKYNIIKQFKDKNIGLIINLQIPGEHPYCGPNDLDNESGFSYSPSKFEIDGINVFNCGWKDMEVPYDFVFVLEIVKKMFYYIHTNKKKILVHCHSGYGRTGLVIACYKIFSEGVNADFAIKEIRKRRSKCVQNKNQYQYCENFYYFIRRKREIFTNEIRDIDYFCSNQKDLDTNTYIFDNFIYEPFVPLIFQYSFDAILYIKKKNNISLSSIFKSFYGDMKIKKNIDKYLDPLKENINNGNWNVLKSCDDIIIIIELLYYWMYKCVAFCINPKEIENFGKEPNNSLAEYELKIIHSISNFINILLIDEKKDNNNTRNMIVKMCVYLLGYRILILKEHEKREHMKKNVRKLYNIIDNLLLFYKRKTDKKKFEEIINLEKKNEKNNGNKNEIIESIFYHYFDDKISEKKKNGIESSISKIMDEDDQDKSKNFHDDNDILFKVNRIGSIKLKTYDKSPSINNYTDIKNLKTLKLDFINQSKEEEKKEKEKKEEEGKEEEEEEKKIPWIKEEDC